MRKPQFFIEERNGTRRPRYAVIDRRDRLPEVRHESASYERAVSILKLIKAQGLADMKAART